MTEPDVLTLDEVDQVQNAILGGKAAQLAALSRLDGISVPAAFCVTTHAFRRVMAQAPWLDSRLEQLSSLAPDNREAIRTLSAQIRQSIELLAIADDVAAAVTRALTRLGEHAAFAVRSSATAEDSPTASFAGQHDSYLNVVGPAAILQHISRCWASLFTERAVIYRQRNGIAHRGAHMAVIVQRMVPAQAAGVVFTADPVTGNRRVTSVEAIYGLGDALVSGLASPDVVTVRDGAIEPERHGQGVLTDAQVMRLARLGRKIEAHFGHPQDIEWCLVDRVDPATSAGSDSSVLSTSGGEFQFVQSRPITTLFPIPESGDREHHVYISVGHQQMMTDAMKPLGLSFWQMTTPAPMAEAGGRLFVDVTRRLAAPASRAELLTMIEKSDPLISDALRTVIERDDFIRSVPDAGPPGPPPGTAPVSIEVDPAVVTELIGATEASIAAAQRAIATLSGVTLFDFIRTDIQELRRILFDPRSHRVFMSAMEATWWLNERLEEWLGEKNAADALAQSVPHNVTSEMGLALLDVADAIRPHPDVVEYLRRAEDGGACDECDGARLFDELSTLAGGEQARAAVDAWLDKYGMRCVGEIDITRSRWSERPWTLLPIILANVRNFEQGESQRRFEQGERAARVQELGLLERLRVLPDGERKADETKRMIDLVRAFIGYREYPKYGMVSRYFVYKRALLAEAERLVRAGVLGQTDDMFFLTFQEFDDVARTNRVDDQVISDRKAAFSVFQSLVPPRVLTSDGEAVTGVYRRDDMPAGALAGLTVCAGIVEGRARVVVDAAQADLEPGDILVTAYTDPSWTPLFVSASGLVTEVGGLMTHGAVIAREYGVPAVVGVVDATRLIRDGQRIRVHATGGYVEIQSDL